MPHFPNEVEQSEKYADKQYEYKHVILSQEMFLKLPRNTLIKESDWPSLGIRQTKGWEHYAIYTPEPHILLFRRKLQLH